MAKNSIEHLLIFIGNVQNRKCGTDLPLLTIDISHLGNHGQEQLSLGTNFERHDTDISQTNDALETN